MKAKFARILSEKERESALNWREHGQSYIPGKGHCTTFKFVGYVQFSEGLTIQSNKAVTSTRLQLLAF